MSDRLKDLQRQRALAQEQLAWLDREIARETSGTPPAPAAAVSALSAAGLAKADPRPAAQPTAVGSADDIIAQYQSEVRPVRDEVKRGCFFYFFAAFGLVGLAILALYFYGRH